MKTFYGGTYIAKEILERNHIYHPVRLEYYKTIKEENRKLFYGVEIVKTEYQKEQIKVENHQLDDITNEEKVIENILEKLKQGTVTPVTSEEIVKELIAS